MTKGLITHDNLPRLRRRKQQASTRKRRILNKAVNICRLPANNTECLAKNRIRAKIVAERADQLNFGGHIMRWQNLVVFLFCLLLTGCGLKVATDSSPGDVEATVQDFKTDSNRLVPEFYRSRYQTETSVSFQHNQMFKSVYFLSLFLFPICAIAFVSHKNFGGDLDFKIIVVFLSFAINFLVPLLSFLVAWFIYFLLGVFSSDGLFVPVDFVCLVLLFVGHGVDAFLLTVYLRRESNVRDLTSSAGKFARCLGIANPLGLESNATSNNDRRFDRCCRATRRLDWCIDRVRTCVWHCRRFWSKIQCMNGILRHKAGDEPSAARQRGFLSRSMTRLTLCRFTWGIKPNVPNGTQPGMRKRQRTHSWRPAF